MPVRKSHDNKGEFYQYGESGKKYYFKTSRGKKIALLKAKKQGRAIKARSK